MRLWAPIAKARRWIGRVFGREPPVLDADSRNIYNRAILEAAEPSLLHKTFGQPQTVTFRRWNRLPPVLNVALEAKGLEMEIVKYPLKRMTIEEFADQHGLVMEVHERCLPTFPDVPWTARFRGAEVRINGIRVYRYGCGKTPDLAIADYARGISGVRLWFDESDGSKTMIRVPELSAEGDLKKEAVTAAPCRYPDRGDETIEQMLYREVVRLNREIVRVRAELSSYKAAWGEAVRWASERARPANPGIGQYIPRTGAVTFCEMCGIARKHGIKP